MDQKLTIGMTAAQKALAAFCNGKSHIVLVTDGAAYGLCGAQKFFDDFFAIHPVPQLTHLVVPNANPKVETVEGLLSQISGNVDGFIAVGGGTTIDTTKLLNLAIVSQKPVKTLLTEKTAPDVLKPCLAIPTTAGTGAEATRFAVCYDGETKYSTFRVTSGSPLDDMERTSSPTAENVSLSKEPGTVREKDDILPLPVRENSSLHSRGIQIGPMSYGTSFDVFMYEMLWSLPFA